MVVDSGAMWTIVSRDTFRRLDEVITEAMAPLGYFRSSTGRSASRRMICFISRADEYNYKSKQTLFSNWSSLPLMEIVFAGAAALPLPPKNLFYNDPDYGLCMTIIQDDTFDIQILGNRVTRSFETIFDIQGNIFGFRSAAC